MDWELKLWGISWNKLDAEMRRSNQFVERFQERSPYDVNEALSSVNFRNPILKGSIQSQINLSDPASGKFSNLLLFEKVKV